MHPVRITRRFLRAYVAPRKVKFGIVQALHVVGVAFLLLPPLLIRYVIDDAVPHKDVAALAWCAAGIVGLYALWAASAAAAEYWGHEVAQRVTTWLRNDLYGHFQKLSMSFHDNKKTGELLSRIVDDINVIEEFTHHGPETLLSSVVMLLGSGLVIFLMDWRLALAALSIMPVLIAFAHMGARRMMGQFREVAQRKAALADVLEEHIAGMRIIQAFGREEEEAGEVARANEGHYRSRMAVVKWISVLFPVSLLINNIGIGLVLVLGGLRAIHGELTIGTLTAFLFYLQRFFDPVRRLMFMMEQGGQFFAGLDRFFDYMAIEPEIRDADDAVSLDRVEGEVRFENVHFRYDREPVLRGMSLVARPGQMVALVGPSGAGKTTTIQLILRFYDTLEGAVFLDGHDLRRVRLRSLRSHIATVMQDDFLFSGTLMENIGYGRPDATREDVAEAARLANAAPFIESMPEGYDTVIGKRGIKLSEGQRQRISIARALLKNPKILLLDEATSSVDSETELLIQQALERLRAGRTTFVIAHRLSTILKADQILFIQDGGVLERGTHRDLIERNGLYARFYRIQFEGARGGYSPAPGCAAS
jgi:ATP-binding cassette subfamily B protein